MRALLLSLGVAFLLAIFCGELLAQDADILIQAGDELYKKRSLSSESVLQAIQRWRQASKIRPEDPEPHARITMAHHFLGRFSPTEKKRIHYFQQGLESARETLAADPKAASGHYWYGLFMIELHEGRDSTAFLKVMAEIRDHLEKAKAADEAFFFGGPDRALGRFQFRAPVKNRLEAEDHLKAALKIAPNSSANKVLLGEVLIERKKIEEAEEILKEVAEIQPAPGFERELAADQKTAKMLLETLPR